MSIRWLRRRLLPGGNLETDFNIASRNGPFPGILTFGGWGVFTVLANGQQRMGPIGCFLKTAIFPSKKSCRRGIDFKFFV